MSNRDQVWLAWNVILQGCKLLFSLRLISIFGVQLLPVVKAVLASSSLNFIGLATILFLFILLAFLSLQRQGSGFDVTISLYRGLIFGDGDGLDAMDLSSPQPLHEPESQIVLVCIMFFSSVLFYVVILNLLIAVFSNQYDNVAQTAESSFVKERVRACCSFLLSKQKLCLCRPEKEYPLLQFVKTWAPVLYVACLLVCWIQPFWVTTFFLFMSQVAWETSWMQSDWFMQEEAISPIGRGVTPWWRQRLKELQDKVTYIAEACWRRLRDPVAKVWAKCGAGHEERAGSKESSRALNPKQNFYIWICHRTDYNENRMTGKVNTRDLVDASDSIKSSVQVAREDLQEGLQKVEKRLEELDSRLVKLEGLPESIAKQLEEVLVRKLEQVQAAAPK